MRRRPSVAVQPPSAPPWLVTYADMMNLLLAVFVLLAAFSSINEKKLNQALISLQDAFGVLPGPAVGQHGDNGARPPATLESVARDLQRNLQIMGRDAEVEIEYDRKGGLRIILPDRFLFDSSSADLKPASLPVLQSVGELLANVSGTFVAVRGHTDNRPVTNNSKFRDNYDLSYARASNVARSIRTHGHLSAEELEFVACGPGQPIATNDTEDGRQANRRVEILVRLRTEDGDIRQLEKAIEGASANRERK